MILAPTLIPKPRVIHHERIRRIRKWSGVAVLTALLGGAGSFAARSWVTETGGITIQTLMAAELRVNDLTHQRDMLAAEADSQAATLRAATAISAHADWSILLAYIAKLGANRITLEKFSLEPAEGTEGYDVHISGLGRSQQDIAAFVLGLDRSGVFASTRLEKSGGGERESGVPFSVGCEIRPEGHTPEKNTTGEGGG